MVEYRPIMEVGTSGSVEAELFKACVSESVRSQLKEDVFIFRGSGKALVIRPLSSEKCGVPIFKLGNLRKFLV